MKQLQIIQARLNAPKSQFNAFGKYYYRSCEDILKAVKPLLEETQTALTITDEIVLIGNRYYIKATATLTSADGKQSATATAYAREPEGKKGMDESQITGMASSYARKYALNGLLCIDDTKDADTLNNNRQFTQPTAAAPAPAHTPAAAQPIDEAALQEAINDLITCSTDRASFEQAMRRHQQYMGTDAFRNECAKIAKKYPKKSK